MSGNEECSLVCWIQWIVYIPTFVVGLVFNLSALWILLFKIRKCTESTVYLANLILNDSFLLFSLPFKIHSYKYNWVLGNTLCSFLESLLYVNMYGSILLITCISVDRYIALRHPFLAKTLRSPQKAAVACFTIWIVIFGASVEVYNLHEKNATYCFRGFSNRTWEKVHIVVVMETVYTASALIMIFCSIQVIRTLRTMRKRKAEVQTLKNNKSVKIVLSNLVTFLVCFTPYHIAALVYFIAKKKVTESIQPLRDFVHLSICLTSINCLFDAICYYFIFKENWISAKQANEQEQQCMKKSENIPTVIAQTTR
ncbi:G-protein coupled receptor 55a isoform X2 [Lepisosteus oculatus]|nr:PREDICTED: lysophosphatidic acid receptor 6-like isoform X2 [Lepisosteus oculatus]